MPSKQTKEMPSGAYRFRLPPLFEENKTSKSDQESSSALLSSEDSFDAATDVPLDSTSSHPQLPFRHGKRWLQGSKTHRWGWSILRTITICLAFLGGFDLAKLLYASLSRGIHSRVALVDESSCSCGSSLTEALALSCRYDTIAAAWLPPHCRDDELTAQFDTAGPLEGGAWNYYADEMGLRTISTEEIALLPDNDSADYFFTTHRWHVVHCSYYWRKLHRMAHGVPGAAKKLEARFDNDGHIGHCEMMFLKRDALENIVTGSGVSLNADVVNVHQD